MGLLGLKLGVDLGTGGTEETYYLVINTDFDLLEINTNEDLLEVKDDGE